MTTPQPEPAGPLGGLLAEIAAPVARILDRALSGADVTAEEAEVLLRASWPRWRSRTGSVPRP